MVSEFKLNIPLSFFFIEVSYSIYILSGLWHKNNFFYFNKPFNWFLAESSPQIMTELQKRTAKRKLTSQPFDRIYSTNEKWIKIRRINWRYGCYRADMAKLRPAGCIRPSRLFLRPLSLKYLIPHSHFFRKIWLFMPKYNIFKEYFRNLLRFSQICRKFL